MKMTNREKLFILLFTLCASFLFYLGFSHYFLNVRMQNDFTEILSTLKGAISSGKVPNTVPESLPKTLRYEKVIFGQLPNTVDPDVQQYVEFSDISENLHNILVEPKDAYILYNVISKPDSCPGWRTFPKYPDYPGFIGDRGVVIFIGYYMLRLLIGLYGYDIPYDFKDILLLLFVPDWFPPLSWVDEETERIIKWAQSDPENLRRLVQAIDLIVRMKNL